jgi:putative alpha-1,2-mannosidase
MYLGDWQRGLDFDWKTTYTYLRKNAMDVNGTRPYLGEYLKQCWILDVIPQGNPLSANGKSGVATTLEYSWDDAALVIYAKKLGMMNDYQMFLKRAFNYRNLLDPSIGFMRGKTADGQWISPFDPQEPYCHFMY